MGREKAKKGDRGVYGKSVDKDVFIICAEMVRNGETSKYIAASVCGLSPMIFARRCCQYFGLVDEQLPEWFLGGDGGNFHGSPKLFRCTQEEVDKLKAEVNRRIEATGRDVSNVTNANDLPTL